MGVAIVGHVMLGRAFAEFHLLGIPSLPGEVILVLAVALTFFSRRRQKPFGRRCCWWRLRRCPLGAHCVVSGPFPALEWWRFETPS